MDPLTKETEKPSVCAYMPVCMCMCVCLYMCVHVCMRECMYACVCACMHPCACWCVLYACDLFAPTHPYLNVYTCTVFFGGHWRNRPKKCAVWFCLKFYCINRLWSVSPVCFTALLWKLRCIRDNHCYHHHQPTWVSLCLRWDRADIRKCQSLRVEVTDGISNPVCGHQCFSHVHVAHVTTQNSRSHLIQPLQTRTCCPPNYTEQQNPPSNTNLSDVYVLPT